MGGRRPDQAMAGRPKKVGKAFLARLAKARSRQEANAVAETLHGRAFVLLSLMVVAVLALLAFIVLAAPGLSIDASKIQDPLRAATFETPAWLANPAVELGVLVVMPLAAVAILFVCGMLMWVTHRGLVVAKQNQADRLAADIYETLRAGKLPQPFVFYLGDGAAIDLEAGIDRSASQIGPVVCLGEPLARIGAGRIKVGDGERQEAIRLLAKGAELIVLAPSPRSEPAWELQHILGGELVGKTVFAGLSGGLLEAFAGRVFALPDMSGKTQLIYFGDARSPRVTASFDKPDFGQMFRFFQMVARDRRPPDDEPAMSPPAAEIAAAPATAFSPAH